MDVIDAALRYFFGDERLGQQLESRVGRLAAEKVIVRRGDRVVDARLDVDDVLVAGQKLPLAIEVDIPQKACLFERLSRRNPNRERPQLVLVHAFEAHEGPGQLEMPSPGP